MASEKSQVEWVRESQDRLEKEARRLWKSLGGTDQGWNKMIEDVSIQGQASSVGVASEWRPRSISLPPFELTDFSGRLWKKSDLRGKITFINIWATWCAPCVKEMPQIQELHKLLQEKHGVQLLTFNMDGNAGLVAPYLQKNNLTFPTLPASEYLGRFVGTVSIPRNWIVDREARMIREQVGFGGEGSRWLDLALAEIENVAGSQ